MNETDKFHRADGSSHVSLTCALIHVTCTEQYGLGSEHSMRDYANRFGVRLEVQPSETSYSHRIRDGIRRGIVWQAAYGVWLTHADSVVAPQRSNHSLQVVGSSSPMTPYTN